jgi:Fe-S cluster assembly protein SufD
VNAIVKTAAETALGFPLPHRRMEEWRWTDLRQLIDRPYPPRVAVEASKKDVDALIKSSPFAKVAKARLVFFNGAFDKARSKAAGLEVIETMAAIDGGEPVLDMNAAFATGGVTLKIAGTADSPIELLHIATDATPRTIATRNRIEVSPGASATILETHLGAGDYLSNSITSINIGEGARLDRVKVEIESASAVHLARAQVTLEAKAILRDFTFTTGARLNRQNGTYVFAGENADARISGSYLLKGRQHADTKLVIDHAVPHCTSRELFKCVLDENARGIFQGKVIVRPGAQKTDGKQSSHALLLSETAEFDAKPELEIFADDVVCGHGATAGDLDHDHLFYMRARGIPEAQARALLVAAFVEEAFDAIENEDVKAALAEMVEERMRATAHV